jgi:hypothetical protein
MQSHFPIIRKVRRVFSKLGSLLLLFQRTPIVQMILPEARVMSTTGVVDLVKWSVATVAGLGVYDTVAGATTMTQISPSPVVTPIPATTGTAMSMTVQVLGAPGSPKSWSISSGTVPPGLTYTNSPGSTFSISGVPTQVASYTFTIKAWENSNLSGGSIAKAFTINVAQGVIAPAITTHPASTTVNSGSTATLTVAASGTSPTFQWYKGSSGVTTSPVSGATSASFTTPALTANTTYWARATNSAGSANSNAATVTVRFPPAITTQPASTTIASGTSTTLTATASGTSPTFQWYAGNSPNTASPIAGATSANYTTPALSTTSTYWVRASNAAGTANSNTATVAVEIPPVITAQPVPTTIASGTTATLTVAATGTGLFYQWYVGVSGDGSNPIISNPTNGAETPSLVTPALNATTNYWVEVYNNVGDLLSNTVTVTVATPPVITASPSPVTINSGGTTTLTVAASGTSPTFQWYVGNSGDLSNPIAGATLANFTTPALSTDTTYWARATNAVGFANSSAATVTVIAPPVITASPSPVAINSGSTATLTVAASGTSPTFQWYLGDAGDLSNPIAGATLTSYTTPALSTDTTYWARATNAAGFSDSSAATVTVITPPLITADPASSTTTSGSKVTLSVTASGTSPTFQWYLGNSGDTSNPIPGATNPTYLTDPITVASSYWVRANNSAGHADSATAVITLSAGENFASWQSSQFSAEQLADPLISGPVADPDGDGISNQQEYVLGLLPLTADPSAAPAIGKITGQLAITFTAKAATGPGYDGKTRHYALESVDNLTGGAAWTSPAGFSDIIAIDQSVSYEITPAPASQFYHLKVWLTP